MTDRAHPDGAGGDAATRELTLEACCLNLRHKMMDCDVRHQVPGMVDRQSDTRVFYCARTHDVIAEDGEVAHPDLCHTGRACCELAGRTTVAMTNGGRRIAPA